MKTVTKIATPPRLERRKRVCAYARVSDGKDTMRRSLFAQVSYYSALIQRHVEWEFAGVYAEEPISGTKDDRAEFQRMLTDCRAGKIDMVITKSITRFARNTLTTLETVRELKNLGVDVFFEKENIHSVSGDGELMLSILASYAQEESRSASENCKWRIRKMFEQGRPNTGNMLGYRLKDGKLHVVPEEADVVLRIFADYLSGMGRLAIAKKLNAQMCPAKYGGPWRENTIHSILRNDKYTGSLLLQKTFRKDHITKKKCVNHGELPQYHIEHSHEAIIPPAMFEAVQEETARRAQEFRAPGAKPGYPFTGLIRCGTCGAAYKRKHTAVGTKYAKIVWICSTFNSLGRTACASQQIPEAILCAETAKILGLPEFDEALLRARVAEIRVPAHNRLVFVFRDGLRMETEWRNPSRRESWTEAMKQAARERQKKLIKERKTKHE
jgi:DNA invertase Pin-like site-specific DNA recombinase